MLETEPTSSKNETPSLLDSLNEFKGPFISTKDDLDYFKSRMNLSNWELVSGVGKKFQSNQCLNHEILLVRLNKYHQLNNSLLVSTILDHKDLIDNDESFFEQEYIKNIPTHFQRHTEDGVSNLLADLANTIDYYLIERLPQNFDNIINTLNMTFQVKPMVLENKINQWLIQQDEGVKEIFDRADRIYELKDINEFINFIIVYSKIRDFNFVLDD
jgi:hypothetical protein